MTGYFQNAFNIALPISLAKEENAQVSVACFFLTITFNDYVDKSQLDNSSNENRMDVYFGSIVESFVVSRMILKF